MSLLVDLPISLLWTVFVELIGDEVTLAIVDQALANKSMRKTYLEKIRGQLWSEQVCRLESINWLYARGIRVTFVEIDLKTLIKIHQMRSEDSNNDNSMAISSTEEPSVDEIDENADESEIWEELSDENSDSDASEQSTESDESDLTKQLSVSTLHQVIESPTIREFSIDQEVTATKTYSIETLQEIFTYLAQCQPYIESLHLPDWLLHFTILFPNLKSVTVSTIKSPSGLNPEALWHHPRENVTITDLSLTLSSSVRDFIHKCVNLRKIDYSIEENPKSYKQPYSYDLATILQHCPQLRTVKMSIRFGPKFDPLPWDVIGNLASINGDNLQHLNLVFSKSLRKPLTMTMAQSLSTTLTKLETFSLKSREIEDSILFALFKYPCQRLKNLSFSFEISPTPLRYILSQCHQLTKLNLSTQDPLMDIVPNCPNLTILTITSNNANELTISHPLSMLPHLTSFEISSCSKLSIDDMLKIASCGPNVADIRISCNMFPLWQDLVTYLNGKKPQDVFEMLRSERRDASPIKEKNITLDGTMDLRVISFFLAYLGPINKLNITGCERVIFHLGTKLSSDVDFMQYSAKECSIELSDFPRVSVLVFLCKAKGIRSISMKESRYHTKSNLLVIATLAERLGYDNIIRIACDDHIITRQSDGKLRSVLDYFFYQQELVAFRIIEFRLRSRK